MELIITSLGLILIFEGLPYALAPEAMQRWLRQVLTMPPVWLRRMGLVAMGIGLFLCWLARKAGIFN